MHHVLPTHHGGAVPAALSSGEPKWRGYFPEKSDHPSCLIGASENPGSITLSSRPTLFTAFLPDFSISEKSNRKVRFCALEQGT